MKKSGDQGVRVSGDREIRGWGETEIGRSGAKVDPSPNRQCQEWY